MRTRSSRGRAQAGARSALPTITPEACCTWDHFNEWKKINSEGEVGVVSLETALRGTCDRYRLLDLVENFVSYTERPGGLVKAVAKNHQYLGVNSAIEALHSARAAKSSQLGVFWHTQGSGKSLANLWFTQKVLRRLPGNWTFVEVTDRKELDDQLYEDFADSGLLTAGENVHAETSEHLRELLGQDHRYVFTLIHKFRPPDAGLPMPVLSERDNIIVITDEAHRSQYDQLAWNMRQALPNASFLGFTGTPLIAGEEELTRQVFGDYVSVYNFRDSIIDGATVPLYYENRIPELQLVNEEFDTELEALLDHAALDSHQEKAVARQFSRQYHLITRAERLDEIAAEVHVAAAITDGGPGVGVDRKSTKRSDWRADQLGTSFGLTLERLACGGGQRDVPAWSSFRSHQRMARNSPRRMPVLARMVPASPTSEFRRCTSASSKRTSSPVGAKGLLRVVRGRVASLAGFESISPRLRARSRARASTVAQRRT